MNWGLKEKKVGYISSHKREIPPYYLSNLNSNNMKNVMFAFGGLGIKINYDLFNKWSEYRFLVPSHFNHKNFSKAPYNVFFFDKSIRVLDLLPYCSRIITKPGFSTFCEALTYDVGIHSVDREGFVESEELIKGLRKYGLNNILSKIDFNNGNWELDQELTSPTDNKLSIDGATRAAKEIVGFVLTS